MAKSKRSKHMRAMRKLLREKLTKKDEAKRLASLKTSQVLSGAKSTNESSKTDEEMQVPDEATGPTEFNIRTLRNKDGQFPSWLSGRQRKRLQAKQAVQKRNLKKKQTTLVKTGKVVKRKTQQKKIVSDKPEAMSI